MQKKSPLLITSFLIFLCILLLVFSNSVIFNPLRFLITFLTNPFQKGMYTVTQTSSTDTEIEALVSENQKLRKQLVDQKKLLRENAALKDQFATVKPTSSQLLPAGIIGAPGFVPGVSKPEMLIIDIGSQQGLQGGEAVVVKDNLIGRVSRVSPTISVVELLTKSSASFLARTSETNATGLVSTDNGSGLQIENVVLSETLKKGDMVVTKGNKDAKGVGYPADLIVGKITDIEKKPSALFQTAKIQSLVDTSHLTTVFIIPLLKP